MWNKLEEWEWRGFEWGKWKELRGGGGLLYATTSLSPTLAIMILQMTAWFPYFHFRINMLKWQSSIFGFREKFPTTFIIYQPIKTFKKVLATCEVFFLQKYNEFEPFHPWIFYFLKFKLILSCWMLTFQVTVLP